MAARRIVKKNKRDLTVWRKLEMDPLPPVEELEKVLLEMMKKAWAHMAMPWNVHKRLKSRGFRRLRIFRHLWTFQGLVTYAKALVGYHFARALFTTSGYHPAVASELEHTNGQCP